MKVQKASLMTLRTNRIQILQTTALLMLISVGLSAQSQDPSAQPAPSPNSEKNAAENRPAGSQPAEKGRSDDSYVIGADDVLSINVWKEPDVSRSVTVRSDGKISLPLVGELQASGETPRQLEQEITKRLQSYISEPEVTVIVTESKSQRINILGMVARPGTYMLTGSATVLDAIAMAGGFKDFAKKKSIYVLRAGPDGTQKRISFNYNEVIKGVNPEQNIKMMPHDTLVVP